MQPTIDDLQGHDVRSRTFGWGGSDPCKPVRFLSLKLDVISSGETTEIDPNIAVRTSTVESQFMVLLL